jgi:hypothetical protein
MEAAEEDFDLIHEQAINSIGLLSLQASLVKRIEEFQQAFKLEPFSSSDFISEFGEGDIDKYYAYNISDFGVFVRLTRDSNEYPLLELRYVNYDEDLHIRIKFDSDTSTYPHTTLMANQLKLYGINVCEKVALKDQFLSWISRMGFKTEPNYRA